MAPSFVRSILINKPSLRAFSTYKFSLAKLSRTEVSPSGAISSSIQAATIVEHQESESIIIGGSSAGGASQRPATVWWGPDETTGTWGPVNGEVRPTDSTNVMGVHHFEQPWFREDVHHHHHP